MTRTRRKPPVGSGRPSDFVVSIGGASDRSEDNSPPLFSQPFGVRVLRRRFGLPLRRARIVAELAGLRG